MKEILSKIWLKIDIIIFIVNGLIIVNILNLNYYTIEN